MRSIFVVTVLPLVLLLPSARAAEPTDWFHDAKWGVMTHYLGAPPSSKGGADLTAEKWNQQVDAFDVNRLADQISSTGAKYLLFTIGQNSGHFCSPNATYDRIVGIKPSKCSRRDLIADLAKALAARNIRLMVYLPSGAPAADPVARKALGWRWGRSGGWQLPGEPVGGRLADFQRNWEAIIREWSLRWGKSVSGWWIDGCYFADEMYRFDDEPNFASFAKALKAGNPEAIVAFNPGVRVPVICHTKFDDYTAGEVNLPKLSKAVETCPGRWLECDGRKVQFHILSFLGKNWCKGDRPQLSDEQIVAYTRKIADKGGVVTYDVPIQKSGLIPQPFVDQLRSVGKAMSGKVTAGTDTPRPWPTEKAWQWYKQQPWICGFNYIPATAINYTEMWQKETFDPKTIDEELALAEHVRFNSLRCVLQYLVWEHDPDGFKQRMDQFLTICHKRGIRVVFCLFDDCVFGPKHDPYLGKQADVVPGWYAHDWSPSPGWSLVKDPKTWPKLQQYVQDVLTRFKDDPRVLMWDLYNEPTNGIGDVTLPLLVKIVDCAQQVNPSQPLTVGVWNENKALNDLAIHRSDIITFHRYSNAAQLEAFISSLEKHGRPLICTEWLKRDWGSVADQLPVFARHRVGCLHWGLVNGKTQTQYPWGSKAGAPEPKVWQHDVFRKDRTPYDPHEIELFKQAIAGTNAKHTQP